MYQKKCNLEQFVLKKTFILAFDKESLASMLTGLFYFLIICLTMNFLYCLNSIDPTKTHIFPNNILIYFYNFGLSNSICISTSFMLYMRHATMRAWMIRELKEHMHFFYCLKKIKNFHNPIKSTVATIQ